MSLTIMPPFVSSTSSAAAVPSSQSSVADAFKTSSAIISGDEDHAGRLMGINCARPLPPAPARRTDGGNNNVTDDDYDGDDNGDDDAENAAGSDVAAGAGHDADNDDNNNRADAASDPPPSARPQLLLGRPASRNSSGGGRIVQPAHPKPSYGGEWRLFCGCEWDAIDGCVGWRPPEAPPLSTAYVRKIQPLFLCVYCARLATRGDDVVCACVFLFSVQHSSIVRACVSVCSVIAN